MQNKVGDILNNIASWCIEYINADFCVVIIQSISQ